MAAPTASRKMDRRKFMNGQWNDSDSVEIASVLVQTRPERLELVAGAIEALPGTQIYTRDPKGKLVVVIEAANTGGIGATLNAISALSHVLTASLVFQGTDGG
ncbi:MAG TPA: chaperone NapD [Pseudolabrys sp.]|nr:chaperone NapD [Pseudolabrys sp.]